MLQLTTTAEPWVSITSPAQVSTGLAEVSTGPAQVSTGPGSPPKGDIKKEKNTNNQSKEVQLQPKQQLQWTFLVTRTYSPSIPYLGRLNKPCVSHSGATGFLVILAPDEVSCHHPE